jgi:hypothetical protein
MTSPVRVKRETEEAPLSGSAVLVAWRFEGTLAVRHAVFGLAFAVPVAVRDEAPAGSRTHLVLDLLPVLRGITLAGFLVLLRQMIARRRGRDDKRIRS